MKVSLSGSEKSKVKAYQAAKRNHAESNSRLDAAKSDHQSCCATLGNARFALGQHLAGLADDGMLDDFEE